MRSGRAGLLNTSQTAFCGGMGGCTAQTRYNAAGVALTGRRKELISELSGTLSQKSISIDERGLTSSTYTVYNDGTKRTEYSTVPTSDITSEVVTVDGFALSQKDFAGITVTAARSYTVSGMVFTQTDERALQTLIKTSTGIWSEEYNAENHPIRFTSSDGATVIDCSYDYMGRRAVKKVTENGSITLHHRYLYRGYLQIACCDLTRSAHPCLWLLTWDPTQPIATRPLAIRKDGSWFAYGWDLTKNICEVFGPAGYIRTAYTYTPYGSVSSSGDVTQPIQWSSEFYDTELALVYYNYRPPPP